MIFIVGLITTVLPQCFSIKTVKATDFAEVYAPNYLYEGENATEITLTCQVTDFIESCLETRGYYTFGCYNSSATVSGYTTLTYFCELNSQNGAAVFSKGHASKGSPSHELDHHFLMVQPVVNNQPDYLWDNIIYPNTGGVHHFVFLWHCDTANDYSDDICSTCGKAANFPYSWTKCDDMSTDGYYSTSGDYVFLGHINYSHEFLDPTGYEQYHYGYFCAVIVQYLSYGYPVNTALDFATQAAFNEDVFTDIPLYYGEEINGTTCCRLAVLGNGNMTL
jgi:hypothetical protein